MRSLPFIAIGSVLFAAACGSSEMPPAPQEIDGNVVPTMVTDSVNSFVSDSGITRYHIVAPTWLMFDEADEPYWLFPKGLDMQRYDDDMHVTATLVCDTARYYTRLKLWRLDRNVRMRNLQGDKFLTEQVYWNQTQRKVYSDSFIHIERIDRTLEGIGFVSNEQMTSYTIRRPTAILPTGDLLDKKP
jgi:LPS export ABC transporter protein LptC